MSSTTELALLRLEALGSMAVNTSLSDPRYTKASVLVDMAEELVLAHIALEQVDVDALSTRLQGVLATVVAGVAAVPLKYSGAPSSDGYIPDGLTAMVIPPRWLRVLDEHFPGDRDGTVSIIVTHDEPSSWLSPFTVVL